MRGISITKCENGWLVTDGLTCAIEHKTYICTGPGEALLKVEELVHERSDTETVHYRGDSYDVLMLSDPQDGDLILRKKPSAGTYSWRGKND